jgi:chromosome segregation ATPase
MGMTIGIARNKGELAKAESTLREHEEKVERLRSLIRERKLERQQIGALVQEAAPSGDMDKLVALQSRAGAIERSIVELSASEAECLERMLSARRYLYSLYVRLEKLRQEATTIKRKLLLPDEAITIEDRANLNRLKVQMKAITGESKTDHLI